jgi:hypothetical protein
LTEEFNQSLSNSQLENPLLGKNNFSSKNNLDFDTNFNQQIPEFNLQSNPSNLKTKNDFLEKDELNELDQQELKKDEYYEAYRNQQQAIYQQNLKKSLLHLKSQKIQANSFLPQILPNLNNKSDLQSDNNSLEENFGQSNIIHNKSEFVESNDLIGIEQSHYFKQRKKQNLENYDYNFSEHEKEIRRQEIEEENSQKYYAKTMSFAIMAIILYYVGASLLIFFDNTSGVTKVTLKTYDLSWQLAFSNFGQYLTNIISSLFGYFIQYGRLFGFFMEKGELANGILTKPKYLMPVDITIKALTISYFHFRWMKWDLYQSFKQNFFSSKFPYITPDKKQKNLQVEEGAEDEGILEAPANIKSEFDNNIYQDTPIVDLHHHNNEKPDQIRALPIMQKKTIHLELEEDEDEDEDEVSFLPFNGVHKPIEEFYQKNEQKIYNLIRTNILPGSNLILAFYFSTLGVLGFDNPLGILQYMLGIMSMFWCMQSFLTILDHNQFPPEDDLE